MQAKRVRVLVMSVVVYSICTYGLFIVGFVVGGGPDAGGDLRIFHCWAVMTAPLSIPWMLAAARPWGETGGEFLLLGALVVIPWANAILWLLVWRIASQRWPRRSRPNGGDDEP